MAKGLFLVVLVMIAIVGVLGSTLERYQTIMGVRIYDLDPDCAMVGGLCVKNSDCLEQTTKKGLCPSNHHQGVECCYELNPKEDACRSYGGECVTHACNANLQKQANDCGPGEICCILI